jgi:hypothetical protein
MNEMRFKIHIFLTALFSGFAGILPALGCTGRCGSCFQCAGFGGILAVLVAMRAAGRRKQGEKTGLAHQIYAGNICPPGGDPPEMFNNFN